MREPTIARNYADALFVLGERSGETERFADLLEGVGGAVEADPHIRIALESPRVAKTLKQEILTRALTGRAPDAFIRFVHAVVRRGRQGIFPAIAREYLGLVDLKFNRVHASVTVVRMPDRALQEEIRSSLGAALEKEVIPHYREDASILGGVMVRVGDRVMDGTLRRRMVLLRRRMLGLT